MPPQIIIEHHDNPQFPISYTGQTSHLVVYTLADAHLDLIGLFCFRLKTERPSIGLSTSLRILAQIEVALYGAV